MKKIDNFFNNTAFDEMLEKINELVDEVNKINESSSGRKTPSTKSRKKKLEPST